MRIYPSLAQAVQMANVGVIGTGNTRRDHALEVSPYGRGYVEAAEVCVASASQVESAVLDGLDLTDDQYAHLVRTGVL